MDGILFDLARLLVIFFLGGVLLVPVLGLTIRFAIRPLVESLVLLKESGSPGQTLAAAERIEALEAGLAEAKAEIERLKSVQEFDRELLSGGSVSDTE